jgi:RimJ/RimL family protein N-acetyltransferase
VTPHPADTPVVPTARHERPPTGGAAHLAARMQVEVPAIATGRVRLRAPRVEDFRIYAEILRSDRAGPMGGPMNRAEAWADFTNYVAGWMLHGHGLWTIADPATPEDVLGFVLVGLEPGDAEPELGFMLTEAAEGRGLATEAARAALDFASRTLGFDTLVSYVDHENARSQSVTMRLRATRDETAEAAFDNAVRVYRYTLPESADE